MHFLVDPQPRPRRRMVARLAGRAGRAVAVLAALLISLSLSCHAAGKTTILVLGDSLSSGYGLQAGETWVELLARDLRRRGMAIDLVNASISGDTTAGGGARLPAALRRVRPDWVIIELGGNDGLRGSSLAAMEQNLLAMIRQTRQHGARPLLLGMRLPPNYGAKYTEGFERAYRQAAAATGTPLLPFFIAGIEDDFTLFQADRIHPNARAQGIIAENVGAFLRGLL